MLYRIVLVSAKHQHESAMGIHSSPPSCTHLPPRPTPLGCHRAPGWSSVSHSKFPLALCFTFGSVYVSMLSIPPSLSFSHSVHKYVLYICISIQFSSVQFSCSVVSDSLRPRESQHTRPPCPSQTPGVHSDSCPSLLKPYT